jgi:hypothetical protein
MTFKEKYRSCNTWHEKAQVMEIYHLAMLSHMKNWTITGTAEHFGCSIGLVSENLRLAFAIHLNPSIMECESRQEALKRLNGNHRRNSDYDED